MHRDLHQIASGASGLYMYICTLEMHMHTYTLHMHTYTLHMHTYTSWYIPIHPDQISKTRPQYDIRKFRVIQLIYCNWNANLLFFLFTAQLKLRTKLSHSTPQYSATVVFDLYYLSFNLLAPTSGRNTLNRRVASPTPKQIKSRPSLRYGRIP